MFTSTCNWFGIITKSFHTVWIFTAIIIIDLFQVVSKRSAKNWRQHFSISEYSIQIEMNRSNLWINRSNLMFYTKHTQYKRKKFSDRTKLSYQLFSIGATIGIFKWIFHCDGYRIQFQYYYRKMFLFVLCVSVFPTWSIIFEKKKIQTIRRKDNWPYTAYK